MVKLISSFIPDYNCECCSNSHVAEGQSRICTIDPKIKLIVSKDKVCKTNFIKNASPKPHNSVTVAVS